MQIGEKGQFLYKLNGEVFTVAAQVIDAKGKQVEIEFTHPQTRQHAGGYQHRRWLRTPAERERFTPEPAPTIARRGAPEGNQYAKKEDHEKRRGFSVVLYVEHSLAERIQRHVESAGHEGSLANCREVVRDFCTECLHTKYQ